MFELFKDQVGNNQLRLPISALFLGGDYVNSEFRGEILSNQLNIYCIVLFIIDYRSLI